MRPCFSALLFVACVSAFGQQPALPYFDWGACPYETCAYKEWTVHKAVVVYDTWKPERREVASLHSGEALTGITGVVITYRPGSVRMDRDLPEQKLNAARRF